MAKTFVQNNESIRNPSIVILDNGVNKVELPRDVIISIDGDKVIAESKILDGVVVFEHISRNYHQICFETTLRSLSSTQIGKYVFPEELIVDVFKKIYEPDTVVKVTNTLLNSIGIFELVIKSISLVTVRGSTNVPVTIKCFENYVTQSMQESTLVIL